LKDSRRYLTKSRFKEGLECRTKLFYCNNPEYNDSNNEDSFLEALAEGGFQVGEIAKFLVSDDPYKDDISIDTLDYDLALLKTNKKLEKDKVSIAEAAFKYNNFFIRVDLLEKHGKTLKIYEVKAKSWGESDETNPYEYFIKTYKVGEKKGQRYINKEWFYYLYDITFQRYIIKKLFPDYKIESNLILADKTKLTSIDGLNQFFKIQRDPYSSYKKEIIFPKNIKKSDLGTIPLKKINVDQTCDFIEKQMINNYSFEEYINHLSYLYKNNIREFQDIDQRCFSCQYKTDSNSKLKSGFSECFKQNGKIINEQSSLVDQVWKSTKKEVDKGHFFIDQINEDDYLKKDFDNEDGMSTNYRQYLQIVKSKENDKSSYYHPYLRDIISEFEKPYHFIDFETSSVALPFHKNRHPYESLAFQYSYHILDGDKIEHKGEYLNTSPEFPNYSFLRSLKNEFSSGVKGTIFRYHNHENTILNQIYTQLINESSIDVPDRNELLDFIKHISSPTKNNLGEWKDGPKSMVDLYKLVVSLYYSPFSKGSNSIKYILPSVLNDSEMLRNKYSKPIYGTDLIPSKNFKDWTWLNEDKHDPYKSLPPIFTEIDKNNPTDISTFNNLDDGGAAMTAYAYLQFSETKPELRKKIEKAMLRYCELDTMAMVIIFEHFLERINKF